MTRGNKWQHRQQPKNIKFCPLCGVQAILRDYYLRDNGCTGNNGTVGDMNPEWWCTACGFGFKIANSRRSNLAVGLLRAEARRRPPNDWPEFPLDSADDQC